MVMKLKEKSFRELSKQYIYLAVAELAAQLAAFFAVYQAAGNSVFKFLVYGLRCGRGFERPEAV